MQARARSPWEAGVEDGLPKAVATAARKARGQNEIGRAEAEPCFGDGFENVDCGTDVHVFVDVTGALSGWYQDNMRPYFTVAFEQSHHHCFSERPRALLADA